ncbi:hypothetical protein [Mucilaginibacter sp. BT774]|uniref:hypothetical protein n=1 Tax=Mucilaginibacter sp. BT774 TaxID=3062276 RepID=UPI0026749193|nr:hypothetical protein [Mucilaginibacter sp. BT774]MDO3627674.1 hypothetical protein [Mucilaginibacter sp. BT774]
MDGLTERKLISKEWVDNFHQYTVQPVGFDILHQNEEELKAILIDRYMEQHEDYITALLKL